MLGLFGWTVTTELSQNLTYVKYKQNNDTENV